MFLIESADRIATYAVGRPPGPCLRRLLVQGNNSLKVTAPMTDPYAQERSAPSVPACGRSRMSLTFNGYALVASGSKAAMNYPAVSGKAMGHLEFDYSAERQKLKSIGPIPEGSYWVQPSQLWRNNWLKSMLGASRSAWGNFRLTIHPYPTTSTHGRGGFFIHGGSVAGSAGCIDLTSHIDRFVQDLAHELDGTPECFIPLIVRYHKTERKGR